LSINEKVVKIVENVILSKYPTESKNQQLLVLLSLYIHFDSDCYNRFQNLQHYTGLVVKYFMKIYCRFKYDSIAYKFIYNVVASNSQYNKSTI